MQLNFSGSSTTVFVEQPGKDVYRLDALAHSGSSGHQKLSAFCVSGGIREKCLSRLEVIREEIWRAS